MLRGWFSRRNHRGVLRTRIKTWEGTRDPAITAHLWQWAASLISHPCLRMISSRVLQGQDDTPTFTRSGVTHLLYEETRAQGGSGSISC